MKISRKININTDDLKKLGWWEYRSGGWWTNGFGTILDIKYGGIYKNKVLIKKIRNVEELCTLI